MRRYTGGMMRRDALRESCESLGVMALYLFGSRADEGLRVLDGDTPSPGGSDLDIGVLLDRGSSSPGTRARLQVALEDVFAPLAVDLVPLDRVDALFQFRAIDGHRIFASDTGTVDRYELLTLRRAAELLPIQRELERAEFGVATS